MVDYNVTGADRKKLVKALERITGERAVYQGMPSMSYKVGEYIISKTGEISGAELSDEYRTALANAGFIPIDESDNPEPTGIVISISREGLSDNTILNFENMISSKGELIKKAFGLADLPINKTDDELQILWFKDNEPDNVEIAEKLIKAMVEKASQQRYVNPAPLVTDNPRYSFHQL